MSSDQEEAQQVFEEDEVVWAKIRGYPWWPAFVRRDDMQIDRVDAHPKKDEVDYTVFFFGDNTHAKLGALKLRKFIEFYAEFYQKAKTNRKLMVSIQKAEEKLRQNNQNTDIFRQLRNSVKTKRDYPKAIGRKGSLRSEPDELDEQERTPQLIKSKTSVCKKPEREAIYQEEISSQYNSQEQPLQQELKDNNQGTAVKQIRKRGRKPKVVSLREDKFFEEEESKSPKEDSKRDLEQDKSQMQDNARNNMQRVQQYKSEPGNSNADGEMQEQDEDQEFEIQRRQSLNVKSQVPRRRGRPKKIQSTDKEIQSKASSRLFPKRKQIKKDTRSAHSLLIKHKNNRITDEEVLQQVNNLLDNREELIQYLHTIKITPSNAKEILDLEVANIIQDGPIDYKARNILNLLKSSLLLKYFPDDSKNIRNYQKFARNRPQQPQSFKHDKSREVSEPEYPAPMDIRKKTIIKLEKFLKTNPEVESKAKQLAIKIESYFEMADNEVGSRYKTIAYKVLSNLKDKTQSCNEIMKKLDENAYD